MNNISKLAYYLELLRRGPLVVDGKDYNREIKNIKISGTFFYFDDCECCGRCCMCVPEQILLTQTEYDKLMNCSDEAFLEWTLPPENLHGIQAAVVPEKHIINGEEITLYKDSSPNQMIHNPYKERESQTCKWLFKNPEGLYRCGVHPVRSITCRMPHFKIRYSRGTVSLGVMQYGRNWAVGCPVSFKEPKTEEEFNMVKADRLATLEYWQKVANDMNCDTYLPEIIDYIKKTTFENYKQMAYVDIIKLYNTKSLFKGV